MSSPWLIYDRLLAQIPAEVQVRRVLVGRAWTLVESHGLGIAMSHKSEDEGLLRPPFAGSALTEIASFVRSWNVREAAIGLAAINSHFNAPERVVAAFGREVSIDDRSTAFHVMHEELAGKKVAVIGHFPGLEALGRTCSLTILERQPQPGDLPDFAAEYILPGQDYVFITGVTLINKTLPRLLELSRNAKVVLVGPSVPLTPAWFEMGVSVVAGTVAVDPDEVWLATAEGGVRDIWDRGAATVHFRAEDWARCSG